MKSILYRFILNVKWFCSNTIRCLIGAILFFSPSSIVTIYPTVRVGGWEYFPTEMIPFFAGAILFFTLMLRLVGVTSKKIHPPISWKSSNGKMLLLTLNILLCFPFAGLVRTLVLNGSPPVNFFIWTEMSAISIIALFLINRKVSNEDQELANSQLEPVTAETMTSKQLKGMRIAAVVQAVLTIIMMTLYFRTSFKLDDTELELQIQQFESATIKEELQLQIDSLTAELGRLKKDTTSN